jgi:hypothetical protein
LHRLPGLTLATLMDIALEVLAQIGPQGTRETPAVAAVASLATALDTLTARWAWGHGLVALRPRASGALPASALALDSAHALGDAPDPDGWR